MNARSRRMDDEISGSGERPTVRPQFDVAQFARASERSIEVESNEFEFMDSCCRIAAPKVPTFDEGLRMDAVPNLAMPLTHVQKMNLDHVAGFVLSQVDGCTDVETLLDLANIPRERVIEVLVQLQTHGIIAFR